MAITGLDEPRYRGGFAPQGSDPPPVWDKVLTRGWIVKHLRDECAEKYPKNIQFMDGYSLVGGNLNAGAIVYSDTLIFRYSDMSIARYSDTSHF